MGKAYRLVEPRQIYPFMANLKYQEYAVILFYWLIQELKVELSQQLAGAEVEVIQVVHLGAYPAIGIHFDDMSNNDTSLEELIQVTAEKLLEERPISELIEFIARDKNDWKEITETVME
jgi:hypothetical protein